MIEFLDFEKSNIITLKGVKNLKNDDKKNLQEYL